MSDVEQIVDAVSADPSQLDLYADECFAVFVTGEPDEQERIAKLLRAVANHDPGVVAEQTQLLGKALQADPPACAEAIHAVAIITETDPDAVSGLVTELLGALERVDDPAASGSAVLALATIGDETDASVSEGDELFATLLRDPEGRVSDQIATNMSILVIENPHTFPHLLEAYVDALTDTDPEVQTFAVKTLAVVARDNTDAVSDIDAIQSRLQNLRDDYHLDDNMIERALEMIEQAIDRGSR